MNYRELLLEKLQGKHSKKLRTGTLLFTENPNKDEENWSTFIFHPLEKSDLESLKSKFNYFPQIYSEFLAHLNGFYLCEGRFYLYGRAFLEKGMSWEEQIYQPYDLIDENEDPPFLIDENSFYFGGTPQTIFVLNQDNSVEEISRKSKKKVTSFKDFDSFITSMINQNLI